MLADSFWRELEQLTAEVEGTNLVTCRANPFQSRLTLTPPA
jgi:hypothetical protein